MTASLPFAENLALARAFRGLSVGELAAAAGVSSSSVSHLESGDRVPSIDGLVRLADALHVSTDSLLGRCDHVEAGGERVVGMLRKLGELGHEELATFEHFLDVVIARRHAALESAPARPVRSAGEVALRQRLGAAG
ncbi:helix-turn-helix domain-containing protein [Antarcticirhabdus aurantiaca]|uniref:helix-turn-helix domain-containing protein n=1 Tax=Antarcticirhabdus aurantiaca TaxID=2606717 RepID=UPI00131C5A5F|nr:helix-turn-helix domain-containing protein [Antarcticirhabdus aurantiaca]